MDTIEAMRAFAAVAQDGSFTAAAERLGRSTRLVSKHVAQLEARLQTRLFNRTTRSVTLTDVGTAYLERCRPLLVEFDELEAVVLEEQTDLSGPIRLTAPTGFGTIRLIPALNDFLMRQPGIRVEVRLTDVPVALVEEGLDLAIRIGAPQDSSLMARRLAPMPMVVCATATYLDTHGRPQHPRDLADHHCLIDLNQREPYVWRFGPEGDAIAVSVLGRFAVNSPAANAVMVQQGLGIARCPLYQVQAALETGTLERLFQGYETTVSGVYALYPYNRYLTARVRALIDHLADAFGKR
jgi:DNA-binding transcriptional LysR family regulator